MSEWNNNKGASPLFMVVSEEGVKGKLHAQGTIHKGRSHGGGRGVEKCPNFADKLY